MLVSDDLNCRIGLVQLLGNPLKNAIGELRVVTDQISRLGFTL